jgi:hypothetical protein
MDNAAFSHGVKKNTRFCSSDCTAIPDRAEHTKSNKKGLHCPVAVCLGATRRLRHTSKAGAAPILDTRRPAFHLNSQSRLDVGIPAAHTIHTTPLATTGSDTPRLSPPLDISRSLAGPAARSI